MKHIERYRQLGAAGYLFYKLTDKLDLNVRYEYYTQRIVLRKIDARYHDLGFALVYRPIENFFLRPDLQYDWIDEGARDDGLSGAVSCGITF